MRQESSDKLIGFQSEKPHNDETMNQRQGLQEISRKLDQSKSELYKNKEDICEE